MSAWIISVDNVLPVINKVIINNPDNFFSVYDNWLNLSVNATDAGGISHIEASLLDWTNLTAKGAGACNTTNNLTFNNATGLWELGCNISAYINTSSSNQPPAPHQIQITAFDNSLNANWSQIGILTHNLGAPAMHGPVSDCMRFGSDTVNFTKVLDFGSIPFVIDVEMNFSCISNGSINLPGFQDVALINISSVNMSTLEQGQRLSNLADAIQVIITSPHQYGASRIWINSSYFTELNKTATLNFYNLPFASQPSIIGDEGAAGYNSSTVNWTPSGTFNLSVGGGNYVSVTKGNLTFKVLGFTGYNMSDNITPTVAINYPTSGLNITDNTTLINVTLNGTMTEISAANFSLDGQVIAQYANGGNNTSANCTAPTPGAETINCVFPIGTQADGSKNLTVQAWDYGGLAAPGNTKNSSALFMIDANPPNITISNLSSNAILNASVMPHNIIVNVSDQGIGVKNVTAYQNGVSLVSVNYSQPNVLWSYLWNASDGRYNLTFEACDLLGHCANASPLYNILVDTTKPAIVDNSALAGLYYNTTKLINVTITDANIFNASIYVNGAIVNSSTGTNSTTLVYALAEGNYSYYVTATDLANNTNTTSTISNIIIDTTVPTLTITPHAYYANTNTIAISGTYTEQNLQNITVNNVTATAAAGNYTATINLTPNTNNSITVVILDKAGWQNSSTDWVISDTTVPTLTVTPHPYYVNTSTILILGTYTEQNLQNITVNGVLANATGGNYTATINLTPNTNNSITVVILDKAGWQNSSTDWVISDTIAPSTTLQGAIGNGSYYNVNKTATLVRSDSLSGVNRTIYSINGSAANYTVPFNFSSDGTYTLTYYSIDNAGNVEPTNSVTFTIDKTLPIVAIVSPTNGTSIGGSQVLINVTTDGNEVNISVDGVLKIIDSSPPFEYNLSLGTYSEGWHNITVVAKDLATNTNTTISAVYLDKTGPISSITFPSADYLTKSSPISINGTSSDAKSNVTLVQVYNGTAWTNANGTLTWNYTFSPSTDGTYNIRSRATDQWGNVEAPGAGINIIYDITNPLISSVEVSPNPISNTSTLYITVYVSDANGIAYVNATLNASTVALSNAGGNKYAGTIQPLVAEGNYTLNITTMDNATNTAYNDSTKIEVNNSVATITIAPPQYTVLKNGTSVTINVSNYDTALYNTSTNATQFPIIGNVTQLSVSGADGNFTLNVWANTSAGLITNQIFSYIIDNVPPVVTINNVTTPTNLGTQTITGNYTDTNIQYITVNGGTATLSNGTYTKTITLTTEGSNPITVLAFDYAGNNGTANSSITKDTVAPSTAYSISGTAGNNGWYTSDVNVAFTATDTNGSGVSITQYDIGSGYVTGNSAPLNQTATVYYRSNDSAGNLETEKSVGISIDKINPAVSNLTITSGPYSANMTITIRAAMTDANLLTEEAYIDGTAYPMVVDTGNVYKYELVSPQQEIYTIYAKGTDQAGNSNRTSSQNIFVRDSSLTNQTYVTENNVTLGANVTEVIVDAYSPVAQITVPSNVSASAVITLNFATLLVDGNITTGVNNVTLTRKTTGGIDYTAEIPNGTVITGPANWDGKIELPRVDTSTFSVSGGTVGVVIDVGSNVELNFSAPVKIILGGQANKSAAWARGSATLTKIETKCNSITNPTNISTVSPRECYIDSGSDLVIWTYHFTSFASYTLAAAEEEVTEVSGAGGAIIPQVVQTFVTVTAGSTITMPVAKTGIAVSEVAIAVENAAANVQITVKAVPTLPSGTPALAITSAAGNAGKVYSYLSISIVNLSNTNIASAKVKFTVPKSWLTQNALAAGDVALYRYTTNWDRLTTRVLSQNENNTYYEADTPGFSVFSIFGVESVTGVPTICTADDKRCSDSSLQQCNVNGTAWNTLETCSYGCNDTTKACNTAPTAPPSAPPTPPAPTAPAADNMWVLVIAVLAVVALGALYYTRMRR
jgi:PGF-pre-PGF domain-containing protein